MEKVAIMTLAFGGQDLIMASKEHYERIADCIDHWFIVPTSPFYGKCEGDVYYDTMEAIGNANKLTFYCNTGDGEREEARIRNEAARKLFDKYDVLLIIDTDEFFEKEEFDSMLDMVLSSGYKAYTCDHIAYWNDWENRLLDTFRPLIAIRNGARFTMSRCVDVAPVHIYSTMHHLSWCYPKDIEAKMRNYSHAYKFDGKCIISDCDEVVFPDGMIKIAGANLPESIRSLFR